MYIPFCANTWTLFTRKQNLRSVRIKYIPCVVRASSSVGRDRLSSMFRRLFLIVTTRINHAWNFSGNLDTIHNMIRQSRFLCWSETWCGSIRGARDDDTMTFTYVCTQYVLMFFFFCLRKLYGSTSLVIMNHDLFQDRIVISTQWSPSLLFTHYSSLFTYR